MPEGNRGQYAITTATGLEAKIILRNAAGGKSPLARRGTSAVIQCTFQDIPFEISVTELQILSSIHEGISLEDIRRRYGWKNSRMISSSFERLRFRLYQHGWETETLTRQKLEGIAHEIGLFDPSLLTSVSEYIHHAPPALSAAERLKKHRQRKRFQGR